MIRVSELRLELDEDESLLGKKAGKVLRTDPKYIEKLTIFKKSVDARKKDDVHFSYTVTPGAAPLPLTEGQGGGRIQVHPAGEPATVRFSPGGGWFWSGGYVCRPDLG